MKIDSSAVNMNSTREYESKEITAILDTKKEFKLKDENKDNKKTDGKSEQAEISDLGKQFAQKNPSNVNLVSNGQIYSVSNSPTPQSQESSKLTLLRQMIDALNKVSGKKVSSMPSLDSIFNVSSNTSISASFSSLTMQTGALLAGKGEWVTTFQASQFKSETETTTFSTTGIAKTSDGREISFNVDLEMSRSFMQYSNIEWSEKIKCVDPLVINLDSSNATMTDQKFLFDIDADGTKENISNLGKGSGYLAYDKNGDGVINDGSELFGAKTGDGFKELARYDMDGNGWIDENDPIFSKLKIWTKDENGKDKLIGIGDAGVGAIYLGNTDTEFSMTSDQTNKTNGVIRKTGVFLKENGEAGTIQHVDVAI